MRNHVLSSRGGFCLGRSQYGGNYSRQGLTTYAKVRIGRIAHLPVLLCSLRKTREAEGEVVHQFYSGSAFCEVEETAFTVSQIIGFLNEFETPPFVFERMFQQSEMYYFDNSEMKQIARTVTPFTQGQRSEMVSSMNFLLSWLLMRQKRLLKQNRSLRLLAS